MYISHTLTRLTDAGPVATPLLYRHSPSALSEPLHACLSQRLCVVEPGGLKEGHICLLLSMRVNLRNLMSLPVVVFNESERER